ncbi:MAG: D-Ala-D-Ala carboxypeptidase family metallohydrolase [Paludibacter sp.]
MKLSENFTLEEATRSNKAIVLKIDNSLSKDKLTAAEFFAENILQPIRTKIGLAFNISSWYRCPALNSAVGGKDTSAHLSAMAVDFVIAGHTALESYNLVLVSLKDLHIQFDQLIIEHNTKTGAKWVHLGVKKSGNRNQSFALTV